MMVPVDFFELGLIGWPLEHSFSPRMHNAALQALGLAGEYRLYPVSPGTDETSRLIELLDQVRYNRIHGLNITIPHKQNVLRLLDDLTLAAQTIGAVNMIRCQGKHLVGDNTDAPGFMADLQRVFPLLFELPDPAALVLGAGGSARAVAYALARAGWKVMLAARRLSQAEELAAHLGFSNIIPIHLDVSALSNSFDLLVNTTPLGMFPNIAASPWPEQVPFPTGAVIYDLVYNPAETNLIKSAQKAGLLAANGLGMLLEQAIIAFETWTGYPAPRMAMRSSLALDLEMK